MLSEMSVRGYTYCNIFIFKEGGEEERCREDDGFRLRLFRKRTERE